MLFPRSQAAFAKRMNDCHARYQSLSSFQDKSERLRKTKRLKVTQSGGWVRPTGLRASLRRGPTVSPPPSGSQISWAPAAGRPNSSVSSSIPCQRCLELWTRCCPKEGHRKRTSCDRSSLQRPLALQAVGISAKERPFAAS